MKKLKGMNKTSSSVENKKLTRESLKLVKAGYAIASNVDVGADCSESDHYSGSNGQGEYLGRMVTCGPY